MCKPSSKLCTQSEPNNKRCMYKKNWNSSTINKTDYRYLRLHLYVTLAFSILFFMKRWKGRAFTAAPTEHLNAIFYIYIPQDTQRIHRHTQVMRTWSLAEVGITQTRLHPSRTATHTHKTSQLLLDGVVTGLKDAHARTKYAHTHTNTHNWDHIKESSQGGSHTCSL